MGWQDAGSASGRMFTFLLLSPFLYIGACRGKHSTGSTWPNVAAESEVQKAVRECHGDLAKFTSLVTDTRQRIIMENRAGDDELAAHNRRQRCRYFRKAASLTKADYLPLSTCLY